MKFKIFIIVSLMLFNIMIILLWMQKYDQRHNANEVQNTQSNLEKQEIIIEESAKNAEINVDSQVQQEKVTQEEKEDQNLTEDQIIKNAITEAVTGLMGIEIYKRNEKFAVEATYDLEDGLYLKSAAEKVARDFTFAAYATELPIARTSIIINKPEGIMGLLVTVGNNQASTQPVSTWTDSNIGPTIFMDWVEQNTNTDYDDIENHTTIKDNF